jgi:uncharacterized membrane protein
MKALAIISYFPVFGWFFPMFFGREGSLGRYHARQGFMAFVFFSLCSAFAWLASHSVPTFIGFIEHFLYLGAIGLYLYFIVRGTIAAVRLEERPLPLIGKKAEALPL